MPADNSKSISKVVSYIRVSTELQGASGLGIEAQRSAIIAWAEQQRATIIAEYVEIESGKNSDREQLAQAVARCAKTNAALVASRLDRFGRRTRDLLKLKEATFPVVACDMPHADSFLWTVISAIAQREGESISERTRIALQAAKARGTVLGGAREGGHRVNDDDRAKSIETRQTQADDRARSIEDDIAELRAEGRTSLRQIADGLNERGIETPRRASWKPMSVKRLLERLDG
jgi:DNA invertase Pin-like site-specific DNA recombinase